MSSIARKPHILKREKSLAIPRHIIFFDTETIQEELPNGAIEQKLKLGWACYYRKAYGRHLEKLEWTEFRDNLAFWSFVYRHTERKRKLWVVARHLDFDFTIVNGWYYLRQVGFKLKFFHNIGLTTIISVRGRFGSIIFVDSLNWFGDSVKKTGERIGLEKLPIDFDTCTDAELSRYCHRDTEIELESFKLFIEFLETHQISRLRYTMASTAMSAFMFGSVGAKIYIHNNAEAIELERDSYRGGRCECFFIGEKNNENYYIVDVNSLYPSVMRNNLYPVKYEKISQKLMVTDIEDRLRSHSVIAKVLIETDEPVYAVRRERTIFPVGCFWVTLTTPELKYAIAKGHLVKVAECVLYEQADIFTKYVNKFYKLRCGFRSKLNEFDAEICKLLLNSLYGKFGQKADVWEKIGDCPGERDRVETIFRAGGGRRSEIRYLLGEIFELVGAEECFNSFPAIAAHVTAYARLKLYELIKQAGQGNYFYCDTDSLIVNRAGLSNLKNRMHNTTLGSIKIEQRTKSLTIRGLKDYSIETKEVIKGIRKSAVKLGEGVYQQERWPSLRGLLRSQQSDTYTIEKVTKILQRRYKKGHVRPDGIVTPLVLDESYLLSPQLY